MKRNKKNCSVLKVAIGLVGFAFLATFGACGKKLKLRKSEAAYAEK